MLGVGTVGTEEYIFQFKSSAGSKRDYEVVHTVGSVQQLVLCKLFLKFIKYILAASLTYIIYG